MKRKLSLSSVFASVAAAVLVLLFSACSQATDSTPDPVFDDVPEMGLMKADTADAIFGKDGWKDTEVNGKKGVEILKFQDTEALSVYLQTASPQSSYLRNAQRQGTGTANKPLKIGSIAGKPVIKIASNAFTPNPDLGERGDITKVVTVLELPDTIEELGKNLFEGVSTPIKVDIPQTAPVIVKIVEEAVAEAKNALPPGATEEEVAAAVEAAAATAVEEITEVLKDAAGKEGGIEITAAPDSDTPAAPEVPLPAPGEIITTPEKIPESPSQPNQPSSPPPSAPTLPAVTYYRVTYNGNGSTGGIVPADNTSYTAGGSVTVLDNTGSLVKTGHIFDGWNTAANGSGTPYTAADTFTISANTTLYAQWTPAYTVTYNNNGSTGGAVPVDSNSPYVSGTSVTVLGNTDGLVKTDYVFDGWNTAANGSGTPYTAAGAFNITADTTLYAQWKVDPIEVSTVAGLPAAIATAKTRPDRETRIIQLTAAFYTNANSLANFIVVDPATTPNTVPYTIRGLGKTGTSLQVGIVIANSYITLEDVNVNIAITGTNADKYTITPNWQVAVYVSRKDDSNVQLTGASAAITNVTIRNCSITAVQSSGLVSGIYVKGAKEGLATDISIENNTVDVKSSGGNANYALGLQFWDPSIRIIDNDLTAGYGSKPAATREYINAPSAAILIADIYDNTSTEDVSISGNTLTGDVYSFYLNAKQAGGITAAGVEVLRDAHFGTKDTTWAFTTNNDAYGKLFKALLDNIDGTGFGFIANWINTGNIALEQYEINNRAVESVSFRGYEITGGTYNYSSSGYTASDHYNRITSSGGTPTGSFSVEYGVNDPVYGTPPVWSW
jgi:uncharacterized repeat protein (TIGR02543 family)